MRRIIIWVFVDICEKKSASVNLRVPLARSRPPGRAPSSLSDIRTRHTRNPHAKATHLFHDFCGTFGTLDFDFPAYLIAAAGTIATVINHAPLISKTAQPRSEVLVAKVRHDSHHSHHALRTLPELLATPAPACA